MASRTDTNAKNKLLHFLDLNEYGLEEVPVENRAVAKREVASFLKNEILRTLDAGTSPVDGEGRFKRLEKDYAKNEKGGNRTANLELEGDLKDSLKVEPDLGAFIKYGHEGAQVPKADGHNQISQKAQAWAVKSKHPKRRYIPDTGQKFIPSIQKEIKSIIKNFQKQGATEATIEDLDDLDLFSTVGTTTSSTASASDIEAGGSFVTIDNLFSDDVIESLLADAQRRRQ